MTYIEARAKLVAWCKETGEGAPGYQSIVILARAATMYLGGGVAGDESDRVWRAMVSRWPHTVQKLARTDNDVEEALRDIGEGGSD